MVAEAPPVAEASVWWAPHSIAWWTGVLFAIGSACFLVAPFPGFVELVGSLVDGVVFFVGSLFFTSAALLQALQAVGPPDRWSSLIQFAGTIFFNVSTFHALQAGPDATAYDRLPPAPGGPRRYGVRPARLVAGRARLDLLPRLGRGRIRRSTPASRAPVVDRDREPR